MSDADTHGRKQERAARLSVWMAQRSSRNKSLIDKACRWMVSRATQSEVVDDFMRDDLIDSDLGFRAEDLEAYQNSRQPDR